MRIRFPQRRISAPLPIPIDWREAHSLAADRGACFRRSSNVNRWGVAKKGFKRHPPSRHNLAVVEWGAAIKRAPAHSIDLDFRRCQSRRAARAARPVRQPVAWRQQMTNQTEEAIAIRGSSDIQAAPFFRPASTACHIRDRSGCFQNSARRNRLFAKYSQTSAGPPRAPHSLCHRRGPTLKLATRSLAGFSSSAKLGTDPLWR